MRNQAGLCAPRRSVLWGEVLANLGGQFTRIGGIKTAGNGGETNHLLRELQCFGRFPFELDHLQVGWIVQQSYFVTVLVSALIDNCLHLGGGLRGESECLYG